MHPLLDRDVAPLRRTRSDRVRQAADLIRHQVRAGVYGDGTLLRELELAEDFGVSRNTVRLALDLLRREGLVNRTPRAGTTIVQTKYGHGLDRLQGLAETLREHGAITNTVRIAHICRAPSVVAERLGLGEGDWVAYLERVRNVDGRPLSLDLTYLPGDVGEPLLDHDLEHNDIFVLLERITGRSLGRADVALEAVNADTASAAVLETEPGAALMLVERLTHLDDGRPVDFESIRFRGDRLTMCGELLRTALTTQEIQCPS
jgi:GntR family transcriptional regulator